MRWTIPNILTVGRLAAAPGVALVYVFFPHPLSDLLALLLFTAAGVTDYVDGYLARKWGEVSRFGAMLDPIADKAIVLISVAVLLGLFQLDPLILLPAVVILFREVFVSGLREFLGEVAGTLSVTRLAKWKTAVQMVAIGVLLAQGMFLWSLIGRTEGMDAFLVAEALSEFGLLAVLNWFTVGLYWIGTVLLWISAVLTALTGWDYFSKARPHLRDR